MNYFDLILVLPIIYGVYKGFSRGLVLEFATLIALVLGVYGASHFSQITFGYLSTWIDMKNSYLSMASYAITFIVIVIIVSLVGRLLTLLLKLVALGFINRMMGAIFGGIKVLLILSVFISFFDRFNKQFGMVNDEILSSSLMYKPIRIHVEQFYLVILPEFERQIESIKNLNEDELF